MDSLNLKLHLAQKIFKTSRLVHQSYKFMWAFCLDIFGINIFPPKSLTLELYHASSYLRLINYQLHQLSMLLCKAEIALKKHKLWLWTVNVYLAVKSTLFT